MVCQGTLEDSFPSHMKESVIGVDLANRRGAFQDEGSFRWLVGGISGSFWDCVKLDTIF